MTLEPRSVRPDYWHRWPRQAAELTLRGFIFSLPASLLFCGAIFAAVHVPLPLALLLMFVALSFQSCALSLCAERTHAGYLAPRDVLSLSRATAGAMAAIAWHQARRVAVAIGLALALHVLLSKLPSVLETQPAASTRTWLDAWILDSTSSPFAVLAAFNVLGGCIIALAPCIAPLSFFIRRHFGVEPRVAVVLMRRAERINRKPVLYIVGTTVLACGLTQALPALALFILPCLAAVHFVAFREMFLGDTHNAAESARPGVAKVAARSTVRPSTSGGFQGG
jgi:hypothetical protein